MKCVLEFEATGCSDCILKKEHSGHGEHWEYCTHPNNGRKGFGNIIEKNYQIMMLITPDWCPFGLGKKQK